MGVWAPPTGGAAATVPFTLTRTVSVGVYAKPLIGALVVPTEFLPVLNRQLRRDVARRAAGQRLGFRTPVPGVTGTWSFGESWASNITAVGAVLAPC